MHFFVAKPEKTCYVNNAYELSMSIIITTIIENDYLFSIRFHWILLFEKLTVHILRHHYDGARMQYGFQL